jgi:hypothetical protein
MSNLIEILALYALIGGVALAGAWWVRVCSRAAGRRRLSGWKMWQKEGVIK